MATTCEHDRQVRVADEWICEDCWALMDTDQPGRVIAQDAR